MPVFKPVFIELTSVKKETHKTWKAKETTGKEEQKKKYANLSIFNKGFPFTMWRYAAIYIGMLVGTH